METQHSTQNETTNDGIKIYDEIINNKVNQILVFPNSYPRLDVKHENYKHHKILTVKVPKTNNKNLILRFLRDNTTNEKQYCLISIQMNYIIYLIKSI